MVHDRIASSISDEKTTTIFNNMELVVSCLQKENQPHEDYREPLELSLIYMGHIPSRGIHRWHLEQYIMPDG